MALPTAHLLRIGFGIQFALCLLKNLYTVECAAVLRHSIGYLKPPLGLQNQKERVS